MFRPAPEGDDGLPAAEAQSTFGHGVDSRGLAVAGEG
jgi:hypothetical protein